MQRLKLNTEFCGQNNHRYVGWLKRSACGTLLVVMSLSVLSVTGAPKSPYQGQLLDEVQSLANIDKVELVVMPLPPRLQELGVNADNITEQWRKRLIASGISVGKDDSLPKVRIVTLTAGDEAAPNHISYGFVFTVEQRVTVDRLNKPLFIPTWTFVSIGMVQKQNVAGEARLILRDMINGFITRVQRATHHQQAERNNQPDA